jgi:hypothetical protein
VAFDDEPAHAVSRYLRDGTIRDLEHAGPKPLIETDRYGTEKADNSAVGHGHGGAGQLAEMGHGLEDALLEGVAALFAREARTLAAAVGFHDVRVALSNLGTGEPACVADIVFGEAMVAYYFEAVRCGNGVRRLIGAQERAGYDAVDFGRREAVTGRAGLFFAEQAEAEIDAALHNARGVAFRLTVTDEDESHRGYSVRRR